jgi:beta-lactamase class A
VGPTGSELTVEELVGWSVKLSDNPSTDVLIRRLGAPSAIQAVLERKGVRGIRISLDERGLHALGDAVREETRGLKDGPARARVLARLAADPNGATPLGTVRALAALHRGELLSVEQTRKVLELHAATETGPNRLEAGVPRGWKVAHKTGTGGEARGLSLGTNDIGLLTTPEGRTWAVAVFTAGTDRPLVEREKLIADVARALGAITLEAAPRAGDGTPR